MTILNLVLEVLKPRQIGATSVSQHLNDASKLWLLELNVKNVEVSSATGPMLDLIKRTSALCGTLGVLIRGDLFDLPSPVYHSGFKPLQKVLVLSCSLQVAEILIWDIQNCATLGSMASLSQCCHELMELGDEFLFDAFWPVLLTKKLGKELSIHLVKQVVQGVSIDNTNE